MEAFFSVLVSFPPIQRFFYALSQIFCYFVLHFLIVDPIPALTVVVDVSRCDPQLCGMERNIQSASIVSNSREMKNIKLLPRYVCLHVFSFTCKLDEIETVARECKFHIKISSVFLFNINLLIH